MKNNSKEVSLDFNLPDFSKKDIKIKFSKGNVVIKAEKKQEKHVKRKDFFHEEKIYRKFDYSTTLPEVNSKKAKIKFNQGKLNIKIPKK